VANTGGKVKTIKIKTIMGVPAGKFLLILILAVSLVTVFLGGAYMAWRLHAVGGGIPPATPAPSGQTTATVPSPTGRWCLADGTATTVPTATPLVGAVVLYASYQATATDGKLFNRIVLGVFQPVTATCEAEGWIAKHYGEVQGAWQVFASTATPLLVNVGPVMKRPLVIPRPLPFEDWLEEQTGRPLRGVMLLFSEGSDADGLVREALSKAVSGAPLADLIPALAGTATGNAKNGNEGGR